MVTAIMSHGALTPCVMGVSKVAGGKFGIGLTHRGTVSSTGSFTKRGVCCMTTAPKATGVGSKGVLGIKTGCASGVCKEDTHGVPFLGTSNTRAILCGPVTLLNSRASGLTVAATLHLRHCGKTNSSLKKGGNVEIVHRGSSTAAATASGRTSNSCVN